MTIKVAMIADHPGRGQRIDGGVQAVTAYLVDALAEIDDVDLHVLTLRLGAKEVTADHGPGYVHHTLPMARLGTPTVFAADQRTVNDVLRGIRPDVVHSQGGGHYGIVAKRSKYPTVVTIHGIMTAEARYQPDFKRRARTLVQAWMGDYHCIRRATHTILISEYVAQHYGASLAGKQYLIPNPVDSRFFAISRGEAPGRILFAGRLNARKGVMNLVHAVAKIPHDIEVRVVLAGSAADRPYVDALKAEIGRSKQGERFEFRGILRTDELLEELSRCACLVLPSYQETAPMVIQEAMAAGVPVIASRICGIPYQVDDGATGFLVDAGDVDALADRLKALLTDAAMRNQFGVAAKVKAERQYHASMVARRTADVYRDMVE